MSNLHPYSTIDTLFQDYFTHCKNHLSPESKRSVTQQYLNHISPLIGSLPICTFNDEEFIQVSAKLKQTCLPYAYCRYLSLLAHMFDHAVSLQLIHHHPCKRIKHQHSQVYSRQIYTQEDLHRIIAAIKGTPLENLYGLALTTGARPAELLGITFDKISIENKQLRIDQFLRRSPNYPHYRLETDMGKYGAPRTISLPDQALIYLSQQLAEQEQRFSATGWHSPQGFIFERPNCDMLSRHFICKQNAIIRRAAGLREFNLQLLRENYCIQALREGVNHKALQQHMGYLLPNQIMYFYLCAVIPSTCSVANVTNTLYTELETTSRYE